MNPAAPSPPHPVSGLPSLDALLGPARPGLILILSRPGAGRTSLTLRMARAMTRAGCRTVYFSLEHSLRAILLRMLCASCGLPRSSADGLRLIEELDFVKLGRRVALDEGRLTLQSMEWPTPEQVCDGLRDLSKERKVEAAVLDSLEQVHERLGLLRKVRALALELGLTFIVTAAVSRRQAARLEGFRTEEDGGGERPRLPPDRVLYVRRTPAPEYDNGLNFLNVRAWREQGRLAGQTNLGFRNTMEIVELDDA